MTSKKSHPNIKLGLTLLGIAFLLFVAYAGYGLYRESTEPPTLRVFALNESETVDGVVVHLTEEDFEKWPSLGKAFKENDDSVPAPELRMSPALEEFGQEYIYNHTSDTPIYVEYEGEYFYIRTAIH
ncbi:MAG: hypothetical protein PHQ81_01700 [Methanofollis sp.]|nr:hypothetical protein [Methanofollis sp.]